MADITAGGKDVLDDFEGVGKVSLPLEWAELARSESRLFGIAHDSKFEVAELFERNTTNNRHSYGITQDTFNTYMKPAGFRVISKNKDSSNNVFISTIEHTSAPIYGVQWHPEAAIFNEPDWIERLPADIEASQWVSRFFVSETRKNSRRPKAASEGKKFELPLVDRLPSRRVGLLKDLYYVLTKTGQPLGKDDPEEAPPQMDVKPGMEIVNDIRAIVREDESKESDIVIKLPKETKVTVIGVGKVHKNRMHIKAVVDEDRLTKMAAAESRARAREARRAKGKEKAKATTTQLEEPASEPDPSLRADAPSDSLEEPLEEPEPQTLGSNRSSLAQYASEDALSGGKTVEGWVSLFKEGMATPLWHEFMGHE